MIQRYDLHWEWMKETPTGEYVKYEDHQKIVDDAVKQLDELSQQVYHLKKELEASQERNVNAFARDYGRSKY